MQVLPRVIPGSFLVPLIRFLSTFGKKCLRFPKNIRKSTFDWPSKGLASGEDQHPPPSRTSGDTTPCRTTRVTLHSHIRYTEI